MRLAWFTPWPPQRSGIAGRSAEIVPLLAAKEHGIDVFVDGDFVRAERGDAAPPATGAVRVLDAHDFVWRHARWPYDLCVYQVGNSTLHRFIWPYLFRWPGLAVLHDARLHHARADALLCRRRFDDYRAEVAWDHPDAGVAAAGPATRGLDGPYYYMWPMLRTVVESSKFVASHSRGVVADLRESRPDRAIDYIALGDGSERLDVDAARRQFRTEHNIDQSAVVFGVHGGLSVEKRIGPILDAFAWTRAFVPDATLLLAGHAAPRLRLEKRLAKLGLGDAVRWIEELDDDAFDRAIAASDVTLNLRWPTALETSGPWLLSLSMGRASVIFDLAHQTHVPALDPRTWRRHGPPIQLEPSAEADAIAVSIDILDEDHSLRLAMRRLASDPDLRARLGRAARTWWEREHTVSRMLSDYERVIAIAVVQPAPAAAGPSHLRPDPAAHLREIMREVDPAGTLDDRLSAFWT